VVDKFVYRVGSNSNVLGRPPKFFRSAELNANGCRFTSIYAVREEDAQAIAEAGTVAGFKGIVWSQRLWADFDDEGSAKVAQEFLKKEGYDHVVYTTGNRGCHIGILRDSPPSHTLPLQDKLWAKTWLTGCDLSIYWHLHLIRMPGTVHESTGLPKRLLYKAEGRALVLPQLATEAGVGDTAPRRSSNTRPSIFSFWAVVSNLTSDGGSRHHQLVRLSKALKEDAGVAFEEALWVVGEVNRGFDDPKPFAEVDRIVRWAYE
jgi:hypothetical protein